MDVLAHHLYTISQFGNSPYMLFLGFSLVILFLIRQEHYKTGVVAALTSISYLYSFYLKKLFMIPRPLSADPTLFLNFDIFGFPSSHVLFYTVFFGFVVYLTYKYTKEATLFLGITRMVAVYMIISVGASRVFLKVHSVRDVIAGYVFGIIFLILMIWLDKKLEEIVPKQK